MSGPRPLDGDDAAPQVQAMIDAHEGDPWLLVEPGPVDTFAVEGLRRDGTWTGRSVVMQLQVRENHGVDVRTLRVAIDARAAISLAEQLVHTAFYVLSLGDQR